MITTVIFDMDGLLTDTECLHCEAYQRALLEAGITLTEAEYAEHWIRAGLGIQEFIEQKSLTLDPVTLRHRKAEFFTELLDTSLRPMPGAIALVQTLHGHKRLAVASSAYRSSVEGALQRVHLIGYFEFIATGEDVPRLKPYPDIFLYAARQMEVAPEHCVVLEDAEKGVLAARAAGMKVIAVPTRHTRNNDFSTATRVMDSLHEVSLELLDAL